MRTKPDTGAIAAIYILWAALLLFVVFALTAKAQSVIPAHVVAVYNTPEAAAADVPNMGAESAGNVQFLGPLYLDIPGSYGGRWVSWSLVYAPDFADPACHVDTAGAYGEFPLTYGTPLCGGELGDWKVKSFATEAAALNFYNGVFEFPGFPDAAPLNALQRLTASVRRAPGAQSPERRWVVDFQVINGHCVVIG